jgi:hypothetical protein
MISDEPAPHDAPRRRLKGICSLAFEGQHFTEHGSDPDAWPYWLEVSPRAMIQLADALGVAAWQLEFVGSFDAEFIGSSAAAPGGAGHLSMCSGWARIEELVWARPPESKPGSDVGRDARKKLLHRKAT